MKFAFYEPTQLQFYTLCPEKFRLRYIEGREPVGNAALFKGLVGHHILANPTESLDDIFTAAVTNYKTGILKPKFDLSFEDEWKLHEELSTTIHNWYKFSLARGIEIIERDVRVEFLIGRKRIVGTIDILYRTPLTSPDRVCIGDFKFGRRQSDRQMDRNLQLGLYWLGLTKMGRKVDHVAWIGMSDLIPYKTDGVKAKKGHYRGQVIYPVEISEGDTEYIEDTALSIIRAIENDVYFPASYGIDAPCSMCEYAEKDCASFAIGRKINYVQDLLLMRQALRESTIQEGAVDET